MQQTVSLQQKINFLQQHITQLQEQNEKLRELFIQGKIQYDKQIRAYNQLIEEMKEDLAQKQEMIEEMIKKMEKPNDNERKSNLEDNTTTQSSDLGMESEISYKQKYIEALKQIQKLKTQKENLDSSWSIPGPNLNIQFNDLTSQLNQIDHIAQFTSYPQSKFSQLSSYQQNYQQISIRQQRIQNLERNNLELQHQLASMSHKLAHIFNAAYQFGGEKLLDYLSSEIGLVEERKEE